MVLSIYLLNELEILQVLCAKHGFKSLEDVMSLVTQLVNLTSARGLSKRKCLELLNQVNSVYNGLLMHNNVRWLSRGFG